MTLQEIFSSYNLTNGQDQLVKELESFLDSKKMCFLLKGYAGTGKTFMVKGLTDYFKAINQKYYLAAPTGRAAKIISQRTGQKAYTLHKTIYSRDQLCEYKVKDEDGTETYKFYYELKNRSDEESTLYIVDESSMVSNVYSEGEFFRFGSGCLLNDFINYVNPDHNDHRKKIIFIGDNAQLPPVNMNFSPALNTQYLKDTYDLDAVSFELTEVVRQKKNSGIDHNATLLRQSLLSGTYNQLDIGTDFEEVDTITFDDLLGRYLEACKNQINDQTILIAYSNAAIKDYNDFIRAHFFPGQLTLVPGDKIILNNNSYNYKKMELLNGEFGIVKEVSGNNELRKIILKNKHSDGTTKEREVILSFRDVVLTFTNTENIKCDIACKIIENLLYSKQRDLSSDEFKAIYIDFKIRNNNKPGSLEFREKLRSDPYFNALRIKFGYAVTCHKAQGGEWNDVFLDCKTSMFYFNESYFRWLYTGITRAKSNLYLLNTPHFKPDSQIQPPKITNLTFSKEVIILSEQTLEEQIPFEMTNVNPFVQSVFYAVNELIRYEPIKIDAIRHTGFLEHYTFSRGDEHATFHLHYNNRNKITKITRASEPKPLALLLEPILNLLSNITIVTKTEFGNNTTKQNFEFSEPFLEDFFLNISNKAAKIGLSVLSIDHKPYHEIYVFQKEGHELTIKFWYSGKKIFGKTEVVATQTTGLEDELKKLI